jgi:uncharacterized protein (DUF697 family)
MEAPTANTVEPKQASKPEVKKDAKKDVAADVQVRVTATDQPHSRVGEADAIIRRNVLWTLGVGVVPLPIFDVVAITGIQLKMLKDLSDLYKVKFNEKIAKKIIGSLVSSLGGVALGGMLGASLAKVVPFLGTTLGVVTLPIMAGAFTHATGKVFLLHFESGGTLLDFDADKIRKGFNAEFEKAKKTVAKVNDPTADDASG